MRYVMTFMEPKGNAKGGPKMAFKRESGLVTCPNTGRQVYNQESTEQAIKRMLDWLDASSFGRQLWLEDIQWAVFPMSDSSIVADLSEEQLAILRLAAPSRTVRFRTEVSVLDIVAKKQTIEKRLKEPEPVCKKPRLTPKPTPDYKIVKKPARRSHNLGRPFTELLRRSRSASQPSSR